MVSYGMMGPIVTVGFHLDTTERFEVLFPMCSDACTVDSDAVAFARELDARGDLGEVERSRLEEQWLRGTAAVQAEKMERCAVLGWLEQTYEDADGNAVVNGARSVVPAVRNLYDLRLVAPTDWCDVQEINDHAMMVETGTLPRPRELAELHFMMHRASLRGYRAKRYH